MKTRDELLDTYRAIRVAIQRVLKEAPSACSRADWIRSAKWLGLEMHGEIIAEGDEEIAMLTDVALFEPNTRGKRAFDRFLAGMLPTLAPEDREIARRMAGAFISIFRYARRHEVAGIWLEDLLDNERQIWLVDEALEASAPEGLTFVIRLFDADPFHAGFGIIVPLDAESVEKCVEIKRATGKPPFDKRFVPLIYGQAIHGPALVEMTDLLLDALIADSSEPKRKSAAPRCAPKQRRKPR